MPRSGSGSYTLPEPAFIPNTPIVSADVNSNFDDIADALTDSLSRQGEGAMQAVLELDNDGFVYASDPNTGIHRTAADTQVVTCGSVDVIEITPAGVTINGDLEVTGEVTSGGAALLPIGLGPLPWSGLTAPPKWLLCAGQSLLRASYPDLWTFAAAEIAAGNTLWTNGNGSTTFTPPDMRGRVPAGKDNMGGSAASRLTATAMTPDGNTLGASGGAQTQTLTAGQIPSITSTVSVTTATTNVGEIPISSGAVSSLQTQGAATTNITPANNSGTWSGSTSLAGTGSGTATSNNTSGGAHINVQPAIITNYIIYAGA